MNKLHMLMLGAALLLPPVSYAAGGSGLASYFQQIPPPPQSAAEAYTACLVDDALVAGTGTRVEIEAPPFVAAVKNKLGGEGMLASSQGLSGTPSVPGMGAPTDAASAAAMQAAVQNMSPQQQQALGQQMAAQMSAQLQPGPLSAADQKMVVLLGQRQEGSMARMDADMRAHTELPLLLQRLAAEHGKLSDEEAAALALVRNCPRGSIGPALKLQRAYAEKHVALMTGQLAEMRGAYERRRVLAVDTVGFADQLAPLAIKAQSGISRQGYSQARLDAVRDLETLVVISDEAHRSAAYWQMIKRALSRDVPCE